MIRNSVELINEPAQEAANIICGNRKIFVGIFERFDFSILDLVK
jgi:hypothetical protein